MTAGYGLAGAPSSGMFHAVAPGVYREVTAGGNVCCSASYQGAFERLEPDDVKVCAVSRTERIANRVGRSSGQKTPRRTTNLDPKGRGDKSMFVKRGIAEDV